MNSLERGRAHANAGGRRGAFSALIAVGLCGMLILGCARVAYPGETSPPADGAEEAPKEGGQESAPLPEGMPASLATTIDAMIALIQAKKYEDLIRLMAHPADLASLEKEGGVSKVAEEFGKRKATRLLALLHAVRQQRPALEEKGAKASFTIPGAPRPIVFQRIDGKWYMRN